MRELPKLPCNCENCFPVKEVRYLSLHKQINNKYSFRDIGYFTYLQLKSINGCGDIYCNSCKKCIAVDSDWRDSKPSKPVYKIIT